MTIAMQTHESRKNGGTRRKGGQAVRSCVGRSNSRTRRGWRWGRREAFDSSGERIGETKAYSKRSYRVKGRGRNVRLETKASSRNCNRMRARKTTTIEGEICLSPIDLGIMVTKPIQAKNDWIANRNNSKGSYFGMSPNGNISKYVLGDQARCNRTIINSNNRNRDILETWMKRIT
jgi:hypothetical protein